ncbi:hypothetical protein ACQ4PT_041274 [Festuca glaucescens]
MAKRKWETEAQIHRKKKKDMKNKERKQRKAAGMKINHPDDLETFDEEDSDENKEEDASDDVGSDQEDIDQKGRQVLRRLKARLISYRLGPGRYKCPWCARKDMPSDYLGMYQHATYTGVGSTKTAAHIRAKHAAYGLFLKKYAPKQ